MSLTYRLLLCAALLLLVVVPNIEGRRSKRVAKRSVRRPPPKVLYKTQHPYVCQVNDTASEGRCTGVLVDGSWVVTAAHCVGNADPSDVVVFCDSSDYDNDVEEIIVHEDWLSIPRLPNDIALLKLVKKSKLPTAPIADASTNVSEGSVFVVQSHFFNLTVRKISDADLVDAEVCNSRFHWTNSVDETTFCATAPSCISDAGSAMFFDPDGFGSTVVYGIASYKTEQCIRHEFPIVYTSIVDHYEWIQSKIKGKSSSSDEKQKAKREKNKIEKITKKFDTLNETEVVSAAVEAIEADDSIALSILLDLGLSPDATVDKYKRTLFHECAEHDAYKCANVLIAYGANPSSKEKRVKAQPLHFAAESGAISVAKVLLEAGAYVNAKDKQKKTPLHYVVTSDEGKLSMILFLLEAGANVHEADEDKATPLHYAVARNWVSATKVLIRAGANVIVYASDNGSPLHWGARAGADDTIRLLLPITDIEHVPKKGLRETALSFAVRHNAPLSTIKVLVLEGGANVNVADIKGQTPLHRAAKHGNVAVILFLLKQSANTMAANNYGKRPVHVYCANFKCSDAKHIETYKALDG